ncbi:hypothetical protein [Shewanella waksmanii]|uniref:hypothetical protein n=1 Tax=Shewanella waksmanii TaxID=213783 RepID=UPI0004919462|nr:hypothetical protein [Shewanella waksmanii]
MNNGVFLALTLLASCLAENAWSCDELPEKITSIIANTNDALLVGEYHGTKESPKRFFDIVCNSIDISSKKITVAIELIEGDITLNGDNQSMTKDIEKSTIWNEQHDGKTSAAMFELLQKLNQLVSEDKIDVVFFDSDKQQRDLEMARNIKESLLGNTLVIALTGNRHNKIKHGNSWDLESKNMGAYLAEMGVDLASINLLVNGGRAWVCMPNCTSHDLKPINLDDRQEVFQAGSESRYQYHWKIGAVSSSKPAIYSR